ncbi:helix-turn-helix transcriptional regulator [Paenibacillus aquistagni]|uniref:Transcriptional regulator, contains XRE-family HTH domain n=1 Tax=Paenibacillus aquistagni TaxID=1852522 RepID=A0A1X7JF37_9BACL|nr:helix-turn-helix transcriptional regulator [Paenibacillus aquistagni]SMG25802.1 Transcriptional regulator, contains XRE-family HTH domain [Paenibacillus aquistagni]
MSLGKRLRQLRRQRKWSQEQVARQIGVTRSAYSHYEINSRQPVYDTICKLSVLFEVSIDYLINPDIEDVEPVKTKILLQLWQAMDEVDKDHTLNMMAHVVKQSTAEEY